MATIRSDTRELAPEPDASATGPPPLRLLVVSIQYAPEITSNSVLITGLARALARGGHPVTVLAGTPHYRLPRVPAQYRLRPFHRQVLDGVRVLRCWAYPRSDGKLAKVLNYASFTLTAFLASLFVERPDVVLVVSPPFWLGLIGLLLKALRGSPVVYNAQDLFPEAYVASGELRSGPLLRAMDRLMNFIYRRSDRITVVARSFSDTIAAKGIDREKILAIPNFIDTRAVEPRSRRNPFSERHGLVDKFVVMYAGNIGYTHGTEILADVAARLADIGNLLILVVGGGSKKRDLERLTRERGLPNLRLLAPEPAEGLSDLLATADVFLLTTKPGVGKPSFPSRLYSYLLAGRPVVAALDRDSDAAQLLLEAGAGSLADSGGDDAPPPALAAMALAPAARQDRRRRGARSMDAALSIYAPAPGPLATAWRGGRAGRFCG